MLAPNSNEESFSIKFASIWRFIYAPTFASIATHLGSYLIKGNSWQAFALWATSRLTVKSLAYAPILLRLRGVF